MSARLASSSSRSRSRSRSTSTGRSGSLSGDCAALPAAFAAAAGRVGGGAFLATVLVAVDVDVLERAAGAETVRVGFAVAEEVEVDWEIGRGGLNGFGAMKSEWSVVGCE